MASYKFGGYTPVETITAYTKGNALILDVDPLDDIRVLQGGKHLT